MRAGRPLDRVSFPTRSGRSQALACWTHTLVDVFWELTGGIPPLAFDAALTVFLPKGTEADDSEGAVRSAEACRPLGLGNADSKAIASAVNHELTPVLSREAHEAQRGFVWRRQLEMNAVELDGCAREAAGRARFAGNRDLVLALSDSPGGVSLRALWLSVGGYGLLRISAGGKP